MMEAIGMPSSLHLSSSCKKKSCCDGGGRSTRNSASFHHLLVVVVLNVGIAAVLGCAPIVVADAKQSFHQMIGAYAKSDDVPVTVSKLTSSTHLIPMPWSSLTWFGINSRTKRRSFGDIIFGDTRYNSKIKIAMLKEVKCAIVHDTNVDESERKKLQKLIGRNYRGNVFVDGLPVIDEDAEAARKGLRAMRTVTTGFLIGNKAENDEGNVGKTYSAVPMAVNNHLHFHIKYHISDFQGAETDSGKMYLVVGADVYASSVRGLSKMPDNPETGDDSDSVLDEDWCHSESRPQALISDTVISYTYSVTWEEDKSTTFATRWDVYMKLTPQEERIHWFAIINFTVIIALLSLGMWLVLVRALRRDLSYYNDPEVIEDTREETGWKLVHGDVFRKPPQAGLLTLMVGSGCQLTAMCTVSLVLSCFGFMSPSNRSFLVTLLLTLFILLGSVNGIVTAYFAKFFKARSWRIIFVSGAFFPAQLYAGYFLLNFIHLGSRAASGASFSTLFFLLIIWLFVSIPLCLLGAVFGFSLTATAPVKVSMIPRSIPPANGFFRSNLALALPGLLPFAASYIEILYIFSSVWQGQVYYLFGFLTMVFAIVVCISAQISVLWVYIQLNTLDYRWWWHSFAVGGSYGLWVFLYASLYYMHVLKMKGLWAMILYFGYMGMMSYTLALITGSVGFLVSYIFLHVIYSSVKVD